MVNYGSYGEVELVLSRTGLEILTSLHTLAGWGGRECYFDKHAIMKLTGLKSWGSYRNDLMKILVNSGLVEHEVYKVKGRYTYYWGLTVKGQEYLGKHVMAVSDHHAAPHSISFLGQGSNE